MTILPGRRAAPSVLRIWSFPRMPKAGTLMGFLSVTCARAHGGAVIVDGSAAIAAPTTALAAAAATAVTFRQSLAQCRVGISPAAMWPMPVGLILPAAEVGHGIGTTLLAAASRLG